MITILYLLPDLCEIDTFTISECDDFVEGKNDLEGVLQDVGLLQGAAVLGDYSVDKKILGITFSQFWNFKMKLIYKIIHDDQ